ncbi:MAG TPA: deoxyribodipyrimidine photo-lyase [Ohtaekwangia sp.]|nr:deoxyribodipyrimidine photo-lyase [Ohtaekwangia sp.]
MDVTEDIIQMTAGTTIFWFRRDLRLEDNAALYHALKNNSGVLPIYIFDTLASESPGGLNARQLSFVHHALKKLSARLEAYRSTLLVLRGDPLDIFKRLGAQAVYANKNYEPYEVKRDEAIRSVLAAEGVPFKLFKDQVIFEEREITKDDKTPYTVFTPYSNKWLRNFDETQVQPYPSEKYAGNFKHVSAGVTLSPRFEDTGSEEVIFPSAKVDLQTIERYEKQRDYPAVRGTSRLGVHLRFGTIGIRQVTRIARKSQALLNELIWRDFYAMILWHFPEVTTRPFKAAYDHIGWLNDPEDFALWCAGKTGYPIVDAGMRELLNTGYMHNRARMITASFLTKHLLTDWRWGEAYFAKMLLDFDLASNNGGWQWAAGAGSDASPYFRIFNPYTQAKKFDPAMAYIRQWVPEFGLGDYAAPIVEHAFARERALKTYHNAFYATY